MSVIIESVNGVLRSSVLFFDFLGPVSENYAVKIAKNIPHLFVCSAWSWHGSIATFELVVFEKYRF